MILFTVGGVVVSVRSAWLLACDCHCLIGPPIDRVRHFAPYFSSRRFSVVLGVIDIPIPMKTSYARTIAWKKVRTKCMHGININTKIEKGGAPLYCFHFCDVASGVMT